MDTDELPTRMVTLRPLGTPWTLSVTRPVELKQFLDSNPDGKIVFVDCQNDTDNIGKQFKDAFHLQTADPVIAMTIFEKLWIKAPNAVGLLLAADLVVFYCSYASARSPAAMQSYLKLTENLKTAKNKRVTRDQKVVLLETGINGWYNTSGYSTRVKPFGFKNLKKLATAKGDTDDVEYTLYTEP